MDKFYEVLGLKKTASDEEIKKTYSNLIRKYDPNNYDKAELKKHAKEKTKQIIEAFDNIMNFKRAEKIQNNEKETEKDENDVFLKIEDLIENNFLQQAEEELINIPQEKRTARWYFLKGVVLYRKGWLLEASNFFAIAVKLEPSNEEYKKALERATWQKNGGFSNPQSRDFNNPYPTNTPTNCTVCDICGTIMCLDMCCNCGAPRGPYGGRCC